MICYSILFNMRFFCRYAYSYIICCRFECGTGAEKSQQRITRIAALWGTIVVNAGILFLFKYDNFFGDAIALIAAKIGISIKSV